MSNEMIKRVARSIYRKGEVVSKDDAIEKAKAAIAAMREPTEEMLVAGHCATSSDNLEMGYQAMIDAALKED